MTDRQHNDKRTLRLSVDPDAVAARLETLASIGLCPRCEQIVTPVTADTAALLIEVIRFHEAARAARLQSANHFAAILSALHAAEDGESDPLAYLRDELPDSDAGGQR